MCKKITPVYARILRHRQWDCPGVRKKNSLGNSTCAMEDQIFFYGWMLNYQELPIFGRCQLCIVNEGNQTNKHNFEAPPLLGGNDRDTQCWDPYCQTTPTLLPWYETRIQYSGKEAFGSYGNRGVILEYPWTCTKVVSPLLSWFPKKPFSRDIFPQIHIVIQRKFSWNTSELRTIVMVSAAFPPSCQPHNHVNHPSSNSWEVEQFGNVWIHGWRNSQREIRFFCVMWLLRSPKWFNIKHSPVQST